MNVLVAFITPNRSWVLPRPFVDRLRETFPQHTFLDAWDEETLARHVRDADVAFTSSIDRRLFGSLQPSGGCRARRRASGDCSRRN